jgi:histidyl-tRNA synthetase
MRAADKSPARYTLIFGQDELAEGAVSVKEMHTSEQATIALEHLIPWLRARL